MCHNALSLPRLQESEGEEAAESRVTVDAGTARSASQRRIRLHEVRLVDAALQSTNTGIQVHAASR